MIVIAMNSPYYIFYSTYSKKWSQWHRRVGTPGGPGGSWGAGFGGSAGNRQFRRGIEEMQPAELRRNAHLIAGSDFHLRRNARNGEAVGADACLQQDFRTELLDDFDAGIEAGAGSGVAKRKMLGADAHHDLFAIPGLQRAGGGRID